jgi:hypothetical protein
MLHELFTQRVAEALVPRSTFRLVPSVEDRTAWESVPEDMRAALLADARRYLGYAWPVLTATSRLLFSRSGDRKAFQDAYMARRTALAALTLGECLENSGQFIDDIVNGIWCICEETNWLLPAHNKGRDFTILPLPDVTDNYLEIFAAETAEMLAYIHATLRGPLDNVTPLICQRIEYEVRRHLLDPYLARDDFEWMGYRHEEVANHNTWVNLGALTGFLLFEDDRAVREAAIRRILASLDRFVANYHDDGGCDEGAHYWCHAAAKLFCSLELLYGATNGEYDAFDLPLIRNMGTYIYRVHIVHDCFVNFGDSQPRNDIHGEIAFRYGRRINDRRLMALGAYTYQSVNRIPEASWLQLPVAVHTALNGRELAEYVVREEDLVVRDSWFDGIQLMTARERHDTDGFFLAAKGGHNGESHNHNDVGNFIVCFDGRPVIIDIGVEYYQAKTFSSERYTIWTMQSTYHNVATVNGYMQEPGRSRAAHGVEYECTDERAVLSQDIETAYPMAAGIKAWRRTIAFNRSAEATIEIADDFRLAEPTDDVFFTLMTAQPPDLSRDGEMSFVELGVVIRYPSDMVTARLERIESSDPKLVRSWNGHLFRVILTARRPFANERFVLTITAD